ncbi:MAG: hypothetical protein RLZZ65_889 [Bacteroidota bacterium]|jgi:hypothetical protein
MSVPTAAVDPSKKLSDISYYLVFKINDCFESTNFLGKKKTRKRAFLYFLLDLVSIA